MLLYGPWKSLGDSCALCTNCCLDSHIKQLSFLRCTLFSSVQFDVRCFQWLKLCVWREYILAGILTDKYFMIINSEDEVFFTVICNFNC